MPVVRALLLSAAVLAAVTASCPYAARKKLAFSSYTAQPLTEQELTEMEKDGTKNWCATEIAPCDPTEGRRVNGSCTNPRFPTLGHGKQPFRVLLAVCCQLSLAKPKPDKSSGPQPLFRQKRKRLLPEGRVEDQHFTQLLTHALGFLIGDLANLADELNYVIDKPYCCKPEGLSDPECVPNFVPDDDETLRFSTQRCINMTKPISFQKFGCLPNGTDPEWINSAPPFIELSPVYGETEEALLEKGRKFESGLLRYEVDEQGVVWPPSVDRANKSGSVCYANNADETRCHDTPTSANGLLGLNMFFIWFWRHHNLIARELAVRNPCWDDDQLFRVARDINIAMYHQMYYYELFAEFMGRDNLIASKVLSASPGFRDTFDGNVAPQLSVEAVYVLRWIHTIQGGVVKFFDESGNYLRNYPIVNLTLHTGFLDHDKNLQGLTQGSFRQGSGAFDHIADPDLTSLGFGPLQDFLDIMTNDLSKDKYFGLAPYTKYREFCSGRSYKSFEDLGDSIAPEWIEAVKDLYRDVEDVELLAGIWLEKYVDGGYVPVTFYCIFVEQLQRYIASDQHWYERLNRPQAFTQEQLMEVRKAKVALLLCNVGDTVTEIQPRAFLRAGPGNDMTSCENILKVNFDAWIDPSCGAGARGKN